MSKAPEKVAMSEPALELRTTEGPEPGPEGRRKPLRIRLPARRSGSGTAVILLALIVFPSALLGFLSWRAIENERSYSLERLRESYRHFARLAADQIDLNLRSLEARWISEIEDVFKSTSGAPTPADLEAHADREPLIAGFYLLSAPDRTAYPPAPLADDRAATSGIVSPQVQEHDVFNRLTARGEEQEYRSGDLAGAIRSYRLILDQVSSPQLRGMAESCIGRVQIKEGKPAIALETFRDVLQRYPEVRDLNRMYLRFLAQYQMAISLEALGRDREALETLLELNRDLLRRSDAINATQYSYYYDLIQSLAPQLLAAPGLANRERFDRTFGELRDQSKKRLSDTYFLHLLDAELSETVTRKKRYNPGVHYLSANTEGEPFLLAFRALPDPQGVHTIGFLAAQINLKQLQEELGPALQSLQSGVGAAVTVVGSEGNEVIGAEGAPGTLVALQSLDSPFGFWNVAVSLRDVPGAIRRMDLRTTLGLWLVLLLLLSILIGAYLFILRAHRAARLSRAQTTFVSNVTHELRTPLSSISMFAELLEMKMDQAPPDADPGFRATCDQYVRVIRRECDRLSRLIDRVIDFSKAEQRVQQYRFEYHDPGAVVARIVESFRPHAEGHGFQLGLSIDLDLPATRLDPDAISQVLLNFLSNALEFSGDEREIQIRVRRENGGVAVDVTDRGIGIEPKEIGNVFDKFYTSRQRMDSKNPGGLGLGLALAREIIRDHGGEVRVSSEPGHGSTFSFMLPATPATRAALDESAGSKQRGGTGVRAGVPS